MYSRESGLGFAVKLLGLYAWGPSSIPGKEGENGRSPSQPGLLQTTADDHWFEQRYN